MRAIPLFAAVVAVMLSGCVATMGDLRRGTQNAVTAARAMVTPDEVMTYDAAAKANFEFAGQVIEAAKSLGHQVPFVDTTKVTLRNAMGQSWVVENIRLIRFPVPQDAMDARPAEMDTMVNALSRCLAGWNAIEPIELTVVSATDKGGDDLAASLRSKLPGVKVLEASVASARGYPGIELRMSSASLIRAVK